MSIKELNAQMRKTYHDAGYTGKNVVFAVIDTGTNPVAVFQPVLSIVH